MEATAAGVPIIDLGFAGGPTAMAGVLRDGAWGRAELGVHIDAVTGARVAARCGGPVRVWLEAFSWWGAPSPADVRRATVVGEELG